MNMAIRSSFASDLESGAIDTNELVMLVATSIYSDGLDKARLRGGNGVQPFDNVCRRVVCDTARDILMADTADLHAKPRVL